VAQQPTRVKARASERDLHTLHTLGHHLIRLYTWPQQAKKGKTPQKIRCKMHHNYALSDRKPPQEPFPPLHASGEGAKGQESYGVALQRPPPFGCASTSPPSLVTIPRMVLVTDGEGERRVRPAKSLCDLELMTEFPIDFRNGTLYAEKQLRLR